MNKSDTDHPNVLCVGRLYCDLIFTDLPRMPTTGTEVFCGGVGLHAGGGAAITAGHLSALGHRTTLAAQLPSVAFGHEVVRELEAVGIDLSLCGRHEVGTDPQVTVALVHNGERAFVTHRTGPAFPKFDTEDVVKKKVAHIHIGEATTLIENPQLVEIAKGAGATLSLDCSWDDQIDANVIAKLLPEVDVFLPNEAEVELLRKLGVSAPFSKLTVVKQGRNGATAITHGTETHAPAITTDVVDTTGAGDAFNAAFISAWLANTSVKECLELGNAKGADAIACRGGLGGIATGGSK